MFGENGVAPLSPEMATAIAKLRDGGRTTMIVRMGEREAVRPDGTTRRSVYWEMTRDEWRARYRG